MSDPSDGDGAAARPREASLRMGGRFCAGRMSVRVGTHRQQRDQEWESPTHGGSVGRHAVRRVAADLHIAGEVLSSADLRDWRIG